MPGASTAERSGGSPDLEPPPPSTKPLMVRALRRHVDGRPKLAWRPRGKAAFAAIAHSWRGTPKIRQCRVTVAWGDHGTASHRSDIDLCDGAADRAWRVRRIARRGRHGGGRRGRP